MMRRMSKSRAAVADLPCSSVTSRWTSCSLKRCAGCSGVVQARTKNPATTIATHCGQPSSASTTMASA
ncbi:hypothetical protein SGLAM104S_05157 [Streptomyces glaucescens]